MVTVVIVSGALPQPCFFGKRHPRLQPSLFVAFFTIPILLILVVLEKVRPRLFRDDTPVTDHENLRNETILLTTYD
jgi:hypothetical protein